MPYILFYYRNLPWIVCGLSSRRCPPPSESIKDSKKAEIQKKIQISETVLEGQLNVIQGYVVRH